MPFPRSALWIANRQESCLSVGRPLFFKERLDVLISKAEAAKTWAARLSVLQRYLTILLSCPDTMERQQSALSVKGCLRSLLKQVIRVFSSLTVCHSAHIFKTYIVRGVSGRSNGLQCGWHCSHID